MAISEEQSPAREIAETVGGFSRDARSIDEEAVATESAAREIIASGGPDAGMLR